MGQPLHLLRGCLLLAAASYGAAPDARARARDPLRTRAARSLGASRQPGGLSNDAPPPRPLANDSRALSLMILMDDDGSSVSDDYAQIGKIWAADAAAGDAFGYSVAIDGDTRVVGGRSGVGPSTSFHNRTAVPPYAQYAKLTASDAAANDNFGSSVAIDSATIVVGAWGDDGGGSGAGLRLPHERRRRHIREVAKLTAQTPRRTTCSATQWPSTAPPSWSRTTPRTWTRARSTSSAQLTAAPRTARSPS